jgi:hypothetical protein
VVAASVSDSKSGSCNVDGEVEESGEGMNVAILSIFMPWRVGNDYNDSVDTFTVFNTVNINIVILFPPSFSGCYQLCIHCGAECQ